MGYLIYYEIHEISYNEDNSMRYEKVMFDSFNNYETNEHKENYFVTKKEALDFISNWQTNRTQYNNLIIFCTSEYMIAEIIRPN